MQAELQTGGETLELVCDDAHVAEALRTGADGMLTSRPTGTPTVVVRIDRSRDPFPTAGWPVLTRGAFHQDGTVVVRDVCTSGFDMRVRVTGDLPEFEFRHRPPSRTRLAAVVLPERAALLARAVLLQYPVMWWAAVKGRAPLHGSAIDTGRAVVLLAGASGVGKSTLVAREVAAGGAATSDNLCVTDGQRVWGVVEPLRLDGVPGRRTTHGRHEVHLARRVEKLTPDVVAVLRRGTGKDPQTIALDAADAWRALAAGTYTAGELRRFWPFAATLAAGTGCGPVHPPVTSLCRLLAEGARTFEIVLSHARDSRVPDAPQPARSAHVPEGVAVR